MRVKDGEEAQPDGATKEYLTPCSPGDPDAFEKSWTDVESDDLLEVSFEIFICGREAHSTRRSCSYLSLL